LTLNHERRGGKEKILSEDKGYQKERGREERKSIYPKRKKEKREFASKPAKGGGGGGPKRKKEKGEKVTSTGLPLGRGRLISSSSTKARDHGKKKREGKNWRRKGGKKKKKDSLRPLSAMEKKEKGEPFFSGESPEEERGEGECLSRGGGGKKVWPLGKKEGKERGGGDGTLIFSEGEGKRSLLLILWKRGRLQKRRKGEGRRKSRFEQSLREKEGKKKEGRPSYFWGGGGGGKEKKGKKERGGNFAAHNGKKGEKGGGSHLLSGEKKGVTEKRNGKGRLHLLLLTEKVKGRREGGKRDTFYQFSAGRGKKGGKKGIPLPNSFSRKRGRG